MPSVQNMYRNITAPILTGIITRMHNSQPIGIFDSGVGGLTVFRAIRNLLPSESLVYLGDTARVPYGTKSSEVVLRYALENSLFLLDQGVKMIVVACNTATACALSYLQDRLKVPVIGVIDPGARAAIAATRSGRVGIVATEGTIRSAAYDEALRSLKNDVQILSKPAPLFVPLIEENAAPTNVTEAIINYYLHDVRAFNPDTLILGCTHYPLLAPAIAGYMGDGVTLVDSALTTALEVKAVLEEKRLSTGAACNADGSNASSTRICVTDAPERVSQIAARFLGEKCLVEKV